MATRQKEIGILTGGGDCPGLNVAIRTIVKKGLDEGYVVRGFLRGWEGMIKDKSRIVSLGDVNGIQRLGGTILQSSRTNPYKNKNSQKGLYATLKRRNLHALIVIGGDDTLGVAARLAQDGYPIIGIPKTIDNDVMGTDFTIGFDTAVATAVEEIDRLFTTAESHNRIIVVELMGRHSGWIASHAGIAAGADVILIPEQPFDLNQLIHDLKAAHKKGRRFSIVVVAEGSKQKTDHGASPFTLSNTIDEFGHERLGGIGHALALEIEKQTAYETRAVVLGYLQRGGAPSARDRMLATAYALHAMSLINKGRFQRLVAIRKGEIIDCPLSHVARGIKKVTPTVLKMIHELST
jgi:ATP-dependent phosphofructokinase / diphosphate-dependent phosphofructokinase